jgi:hypothetical protein
MAVDAGTFIEGIGPFELDARVAWAFRRGVGDRWTRSDLAALTESLSDPSRAAGFAAGLTAGTVVGARDAVEEYVRSTLDLLVGVSNWTVEAFATVYDPELFGPMLKVYASAPNTVERVRALQGFADLYRAQHPAGADALQTLAETLPVLDKIVEWLQGPGAVAQVLVAAARSLGDLLGSELGALRELIGNPHALGREVGYLIGQIVVQLAQFVLGI